MQTRVQLSLCLGFLLLGTLPALGSDQIPGAPQKRPIAIVGATLHPVATDVIQRGVIVFDQGRITQIAEGVAVPEGCEVIRGEGKHVYPSLIEAYSDIGLVEINSVRATLDARETGNLNPNVRAAAAFNPDSELIPVNRSGGILLAVSAPQGGLLSGRSSLMMLDGWTWEDMTLKADVGMHVSWPRSGGLDELEEVFDQTKRYVAAREQQAAKQPRDLRLEAMAKVLDGSMPLIANATSLSQIQSAVAFANRHEVRLIIHGGYGAPKCARLLVEQKVPVIVSGVYRNPRRRHEPYDEGYTLPSQLQEAGVPFCISAGGRFGASGIRNLPYNAATAAAYGLSEEDALRSITLSPAEILGVSDRVGALRVGADATLLITDGNILETPTQVEAAFIQGRQVDLENKHTQLYRKYSTKYQRQR